MNSAAGRFGPRRRLLIDKGVDLACLEQFTREQTRFIGSDTTGIYCFPTCHNARRISERHLVPFTTAAAAIAAGYRPCAVCRPSSGL